MSSLKPETRDKLKKVTTPTLMTALYRRGLRQQSVQDVRCVVPKAVPMVGEAFTLRYMPPRQDLNAIEVFRNHDHPQRFAVEQCPPGAVMMIDSRKASSRGVRRFDPDFAPNQRLRWQSLRTAVFATARLAETERALTGRPHHRTK